MSTARAAQMLAVSLVDGLAIQDAAEGLRLAMIDAQLAGNKERATALLHDLARLEHAAGQPAAVAGFARPAPAAQHARVGRALEVELVGVGMDEVQQGVRRLDGLLTQLLSGLREQLALELRKLEETTRAALAERDAKIARLESEARRRAPAAAAPATVAGELGFGELASLVARADVWLKLKIETTADELVLSEHMARGQAIQEELVSAAATIAALPASPLSKTYAPLITAVEKLAKRVVGALDPYRARLSAAQQRKLDAQSRARTDVRRKTDEQVAVLQTRITALQAQVDGCVTDEERLRQEIERAGVPAALAERWASLQAQSRNKVSGMRRMAGRVAAGAAAVASGARAVLGFLSATPDDTSDEDGASEASARQLQALEADEGRLGTELSTCGGRTQALEAFRAEAARARSAEQPAPSPSESSLLERLSTSLQSLAELTGIDLRRTITDDTWIATARTTTRAWEAIVQANREVVDCNRKVQRRWNQEPDVKAYLDLFPRRSPAAAAAAATLQEMQDQLLSGVADYETSVQALVDRTGAWRERFNNTAVADVLAAVDISRPIDEPALAIALTAEAADAAQEQRRADVTLARSIQQQATALLDTGVFARALGACRSVEDKYAAQLIRLRMRLADARRAEPSPPGPRPTPSPAPTPVPAPQPPRVPSPSPAPSSELRSDQAKVALLHEVLQHLAFAELRSALPTPDNYAARYSPALTGTAGRAATAGTKAVPSTFLWNVDEKEKFILWLREASSARTRPLTTPLNAAQRRNLDDALSISRLFFVDNPTLASKLPQDLTLGESTWAPPPGTTGLLRLARVNTKTFTDLVKTFGADPPTVTAVPQNALFWEWIVRVLGPTDAQTAAGVSQLEKQKTPATAAALDAYVAEFRTRRQAGNSLLAVLFGDGAAALRNSAVETHKFTTLAKIGAELAGAPEDDYDDMLSAVARAPPAAAADTSWGVSGW